MAKHSRRLGYQPALDGLRAVAVVAVLLYHGGASWASGGFLGVDVFFVLSGFLITSLLIDERTRTGAVGIVAFYGRRLRRLVPALLLVLAAVTVYAATLTSHTQLLDLRGDVLATLGYVMNWHLVLADRGYFAGFNAPSPLKHTWSLAVEEQWYLVWPVVTAALLGFARRVPRLRLGLAVTALLCAASAAWMWFLFTPGTDPSRVYYGTDTRAQELLAGAVLAYACALAGTFTFSRWPRGLDAAGVGALGFVLWLCTVVDDQTEWLYRGGLLLLSAAVVVVVVAAVQPATVVRRVLGVRPVRYVGAISYGLYLWHFPVYVVMSSSRTGISGTTLLLARLAVTGAIAALSYHLVELPVRVERISRRTLTTSAPVLVLATLVVLFMVVNLTPPTGAAFASTTEHAAPPPVTQPRAGRVIATGDSLSLTLSWGFPQGGGDRPAYLTDESVIGCQLFPSERVFGSIRTDGGPDCAPWRDKRRIWLQGLQPDVVVVLSGVWETWDKIVDGKRLDFGTPEFDAWFDGQIDALIADFSGGGARVVLLTAPCNARAEDVTGVEPPENQPDRIAHLNDLYRQAADRNPDHASVIDLDAFLCPDGRFVGARDGEQLRSDDGVHFTGPGARQTWNWLLPQVEALLPAS